MSMAYWVDSEGTRHNVKNLGWLLRHWSRVDSFEVSQGGLGIHGLSYSAVLRANLRNGGYYRAGFASLRVLMEFLDRPNFRGVKVTFKVPVLRLHPVNMTIQLGDVVLDVGSPDYRALPQ
jgi:hypothetical protein